MSTLISYFLTQTELRALAEERGWDLHIEQEQQDRLS